MLCFVIGAENATCGMLRSSVISGINGIRSQPYCLWAISFVDREQRQRSGCHHVQAQFDSMCIVTSMVANLVDHGVGKQLGHSRLAIMKLELMPGFPISDLSDAPGNSSTRLSGSRSQGRDLCYGVCIELQGEVRCRKHADVVDPPPGRRKLIESVVVHLGEVRIRERASLSDIPK